MTISNLEDLINGKSDDESFIYIFIASFILTGGIIAYITILTKRILKK